MRRTASDPLPAGGSTGLQIAAMLLINGLMLVWAIYAGWSLFSVFIFYWMETVALLIGFLVAALLGTARLDGRRLSRWRQRLVAVLILGGMQGIAAGFFLFFVVGFIGSLTYGGHEPAIAEALGLVPILIGLIAVHGLLFPAIDRLHMALGNPHRLIDSLPAGRFVRLHLGIFTVGVIALMSPASDMTVLVIAVMVLKMAVEAWLMRSG